MSPQRPRSSRFVPDRGDLVWLSFDPQAGREQAGRRPALVLSPVSYNSVTGLLIACPITSQIKGYPFEVVLPPGLRTYGAVLTDHLKSLDWTVRQAIFIENAPAEILDEVTAKLMPLVGAE